MSSHEIFPSILPDDWGYKPDELSQKIGEENHYQILRKMAQHVDSGEINGKSTQLEIIHFFAGRYPKDDVDEYVEEARAKVENDE